MILAIDDMTDVEIEEEVIRCAEKRNYQVHVTAYGCFIETHHNGWLIKFCQPNTLWHRNRIGCLSRTIQDNYHKQREDFKNIEIMFNYIDYHDNIIERKRAYRTYYRNR